MVISCRAEESDDTLTVLDYAVPIGPESVSRGCFASGFALRCTDDLHHPTHFAKDAKWMGHFRFNSM